MRQYGHEDLAILVSERGHYSLKKAADMLGIGQEALVAVKTDVHNRISTRSRAENHRVKSQ